MKFMQSIKKSILWDDPVVSKLYANGITAFITYYFVKYTGQISNSNNATTFTNSEIGDIFIDLQIFFQTPFGLFLKCAILFVVAIYFIYNLFKMYKGYILKRDFNKFRSANFWKADFKWKWRKYGDDFKIDYSDIQKICPHCRHDLVYKNDNYGFKLKCNNCEFESSIFHSSSDDLRSFVLGKAGPKFHSVFISKINASLREKGLR